MTAAERAKEIAAKIGAAHQSGAGWMVRCPVHGDQKASLSIYPSRDGRRVQLKCHAGCEPTQIVEAAGLTLDDLECALIRVYDYRDESGTLLYQTCRFAPKDFRVRRPNGKGGHEWKLNGVQKVLYHLPQLRARPAGEPIFLVEGEKDADNLVGLSCLATTVQGGSKAKWLPTYSEQLRGAHVVILPDNDKPGRAFAATAAKALHGVVASVKVIDLPNLPAKGDVSDWIEDGGTRGTLLELVEAAPLWEPVLEELVPGSTEPALVPEEIVLMNKTYAVTWAGANVVILKEYHDASLGRDTVAFVQPEHLRLHFANRVVAPPGSRSQPLVDYWLKHPARRTYDDVIFAPGEDCPGCYNLWRGWAVEPNSVASCERFLWHLRHIICAGNEEHYTWVLAWMAHAVQKPNSKPGTALVMRGDEGIGKGLFAHYFGKLYGEHYTHILNAEDFVGRFNEHLKGMALCFADEAFFAGDRRHAGVLKGMITEPTLLIEPKFKGKFRINNLIRLLISSNNDWVIPADATARRYFVLDVPATKKGDTEYFRLLGEEMDGDGPAALLHYLRHHVNLGASPYNRINLHEAPKTQALLEQKHLTMSPSQRFFFERLGEGVFLPHETDESSPWRHPGDEDRAWVPTREFYDAFIEESRKVNDRYRQSPESFGRDLRKFLVGTNPVLLAKWKTLEKQEWNPETRAMDHRPERCRAYGFPSLVECRKAFARYLGQEIPWPEEKKPVF